MDDIPIEIVDKNERIRHSLSSNQSGKKDTGGVRLCICEQTKVDR